MGVKKMLIQERIHHAKSAIEDLSRLGFSTILIAGDRLIIYGTAGNIDRWKKEFYEYEHQGQFLCYGFKIEFMLYEHAFLYPKYQACVNIIERLRKSFWAYILFRLKI